MNTSGLWIVTCFFNPVGYTLPLRNFERCIGPLREMGYPVLVVELAIGDTPFSIPEGDRVLRLRTSSVLWHKERLINLAIQTLPPECTKIAWVDSDLLFDSPDCFHQADTLLDDIEVVQLFDRISYLPPGHEQFSGVSLYERESLFSALHANSSAYFLKQRNGRIPYAVPGGALAARREVLAAGLYDRDILGSNDVIFSYAVCGALDQLEPATEAFGRDIREWEKRFNEHRRSYSFGVVPGTVYHLWHGTRSDRAYASRAQRLSAQAFDPGRDLTADESGCYVITPEKPALELAVKEYFLSRNEDGNACHESPRDATLSSHVLISNLYQRLYTLQLQKEEIELTAEQAVAEITRLGERINELRRWTEKLEEAKDWHEQQSRNWQRRALSGPPESGNGGFQKALLLTYDTVAHRELLTALAAHAIVIPSPHTPDEPGAGSMVSFRVANSCLLKQLDEAMTGRSLLIALTFDQLGNEELETVVRKACTARIRIARVGSAHLPRLYWQKVKGSDEFVNALREVKRRERLLRDITANVCCLDVSLEELLCDGDMMKTFATFIGVNPDTPLPKIETLTQEVASLLKPNGDAPSEDFLQSMTQLPEWGYSITTSRDAD